MAAPSPLPRHLYKILPSAPASPLPAEWPLSDLDRADGFIHFSTAAQIPVTAGRFFAGAPALWILKLSYARFAHGTRWEPAGSDVYPHLYGENFGGADVLDVRVFERADGRAWADVFDGEAWLEE